VETTCATDIESMKLIPFEIAIGEIIFLFLGKLAEIKVGHQVGFDEIHGFLEALYKLVEVFFVKKHLVFLVGEISILACVASAFGDGDVVVVGTGRFHIKKIRPLTCSHTF
jgi:hypothetical protein